MTPFPISESTPITYAGPPPTDADVVVMGGGVMGVCTALFLARAGQKVVLCEKGRIAGEQSSRNWGWIRQTGRDPDELPIVTEAVALWQQLARETNTDMGLKQCGVTYLAETDEELQGYQNWLTQVGDDAPQPEHAVGLQRAQRAGGQSLEKDPCAVHGLTLVSASGGAGRAGRLKYKFDFLEQLVGPVVALAVEADPEQAAFLVGQFTLHVPQHLLLVRARM